MSLTDKTSRKNLELCQNRMLRITTGAVKTTPTIALRVATGNDPLQDDHDLQALTLHETLNANKCKHSWYQKNTSKTTLTTQRTFKDKVNELISDRTTSKVLPSPPLIHPLDYLDIKSELSLTQPISSCI